MTVMDALQLLSISFPVLLTLLWENGENVSAFRCLVLTELLTEREIRNSLNPQSIGDLFNVLRTKSCYGQKGSTLGRRKNLLLAKLKSK